MKIEEAIREFQLIPPVDPTLAQSRDLANRENDLSGARVALLDNRKGNANTLLVEIGEQLRQGHGAAEAQLFTKPIFSRPSPEALIKDVSQFDVVITAIGD